MTDIYFERAIFISWYCSKGDCKFCYMSTQKDKIKNPRLARRTKESILAEARLCKLLDWKIEFISGGYESFTMEEIKDLLKEIKNIYKEKLWLNIGTLTEEELIILKPYTVGVSGPLECVNPKLRKIICPSKPMEDIDIMFKAADKLGLKKSITIILGLGETIDDFKHLKKIIKDYNVDQITFYRLKPQKGTVFENAKPITKEYFVDWIAKTHQEFPGIKIIVGSWIGHLDEISDLIKAGASGITKFPAIKMFGNKYAKQIESEVNKVAVFKSNLTRKVTDVDKKNIYLEHVS